MPVMIKAILEEKCKLISNTIYLKLFWASWKIIHTEWPKNILCEIRYQARLALLGHEWHTNFTEFGTKQVKAAQFKSEASSWKANKVFDK